MTANRAPGGGSGIRTHDTVARIHAFQACAFSHSAIPPARGSAQYSEAVRSHNPRGTGRSPRLKGRNFTAYAVAFTRNTGADVCRRLALPALTGICYGRGDKKRKHTDRPGRKS
jgi:hypothetical protein